MAKTLFYEDVGVGDALPELIKNPTTRQLVRYAAASADFYEIHYDKDFALQNNLPGVILHGALKNAFLGQIVTDWIGESGMLKKLSVRYHGMDVPGTPLTCTGIVTNKRVEGNQHLIDCDLSIANAKGEITTTGAATVTLPSRNPQ